MIRVSRALFVAALATGCAGSFGPMPKGKQVAIHRGGFVRDGRLYRQGMWGSGLIAAVQGNPAAVEAARAYRRSVIYSSMVAIPSWGCLGWLVGDNLVRWEGMSTTEVAVFAACTVGALTSELMSASGRTHLFRAINLYNAGLPDQPAVEQ